MEGENPTVTPWSGEEPEPGDEPAGDNYMVTGDERVDEAVAGLARLTDVPVEDHPAVLEQVHLRLGEILGEVESGDDQSPA